MNLPNKLTLINANSNTLTLLIKSPKTFESHFELTIAEGYNEFPDALVYVAKLLTNKSVNPRWWMYYFVQNAPKTLVGIGGFKGPPTSDGTVEIGYGIAPTFRQMGFATEAARQLIHIAKKDHAVRKIIAHTQPHFGPSCKVLQRNQFVLQGEIIDPDDGAVWRWVHG